MLRLCGRRPTVHLLYFIIGVINSISRLFVTHLFTICVTRMSEVEQSWEQSALLASDGGEGSDQGRASGSADKKADDEGELDVESVAKPEENGKVLYYSRAVLC